MAEISNKALALLLIAAIIVSLGGMLITLNRLSKLFVPGVTGFASDTGTLTLQVAENVEINFTMNQMDWGSGAVDSDKTTCLLQSNYTNGTGTGNNCTVDDFYGNVSDFVVANQGNRNVTLNITGKTALNFFNVTGGSYRFNISSKDSEKPCVNASGEVRWANPSGDANQTQISWTSFQGTGAANEIAICNETGYGVPFDPDNNEFYIGIQLVLPYTATGTFTDTITLEATALSK